MNKIKRDGRRLDHKTAEEFRLLAVKRVRENGEKPSAVMASLGLCRTTLYKWLRVSDAKGMKALASKKGAGRKPALDARQRARLKKMIVNKDPRQYSFPFALWTRKIVAELIHQKFGVPLGLTAVGRLLARLDITPQKPLRRAYERDEKAVKKWGEEEYPQLRKRAQKYGAKIFFLDEAGFSSEPNLGRTYGAKGKTPVVKTSGQRQKVNAISAVNAKGAFWSATYTGMFNATRFLGFLKAFRRRRKDRVLLVLDGHPAHHAKLIQE
jgi:transposase